MPAHTHKQTHRPTHTCSHLLPSAVQPPTSRTRTRLTGPTTDATPGPQEGAMLGHDLRPLPWRGSAPRPSQRGLVPGVRRGSVCGDNRVCEGAANTVCAEEAAAPRGVRMRV